MRPSLRIAAGVLALGVVLLLAASRIPAQFDPWIVLAAGIVVTLLGARAVAREVRSRLPFAHAHPHVHPHAHPHAHDHVHAPGDEHHDHEDDHHHHDDHARYHQHPHDHRHRAAFVTAIIVAAVGAAMIGQGFVALGLGVPVPLTAGLVLAAVGGYAFAWHRERFASELRA